MRNRKNILILVLVAVLCLVCLQATADTIDSGTAKKMAETARAIQARIEYFRDLDYGNGYTSCEYANWQLISWPGFSVNGCSVGGAPYYPSDDYYSGIGAADAIGVVESFFHASFVKDYAITYSSPDLILCNQFVPDLEGLTYVYNFTKDSYFIDPYDINITNYLAVLQTIHDAVIYDFLYLSTPALIEYESGEKKYWGNGTGSNFNTAYSNANSDFSEYLGSEYFLPGVSEWSEVDGGGNCSVGLYTKPFYLYCNNVIGHSGSAACYIRIQEPYLSPYDGYSNFQEEWTETNTFQKLNDSAIALDTNWQSPWFATDIPTSSPCDASSGDQRGGGWHLIDKWIMIEPDFNALVPDTETNSVTIIVDKGDSGGPYFVYSANPDCDQVKKGETVKGTFDCSTELVWSIHIELLENYYETTAAALKVGGNSITAVTPTVCITPTGDETTIDSLDFEVVGLVGKTEIKLKVTFNLLSHTEEKELTFKVKPNHFNICCSTWDNGPGPSQRPIVDDAPRIEKSNIPSDGRYKMVFPKLEESYMVNDPPCGFLSIKEVTVAGGETSFEDIDGQSKVFDTSGGLSDGRLKRKVNALSNPVVTYSYDPTDGKLTAMTDTTKTDTYREYTYGAGGVITGYIDHVGHAEGSHSGTSCRTHTVSTDSDGMITQVSDAGCGCSGEGNSGRIYSYNDDKTVDQIKIKDSGGSEVVVTEYEYGQITGRLSKQWLGEKTDGKQVLEVIWNETDNEVTYKKYIDSTNYIVTRDKRDAVGKIIKTIEYEDLNENPDDPTGSVYEQIIEYGYSGEVPSYKVVIPPKGNPAGTGIRKKYSYDLTTGNVTSVDWYDSTGNSKRNVENFYDAIRNTDNEVVGSVLTKSTNAVGSETDFHYASTTDIVPDYRLMPKTTLVPINDGMNTVNEDQQLKYEYEYDSEVPDRVIEERQVKITDFGNLTGDIIIATHYKYDSSGNLEEKYNTNDGDDSVSTNHLLKTKYKYNDFNQVIRTTFPNGSVSGKSYYDSGRVKMEFVLANPADIDLEFPNVISLTTYEYDQNGQVKDIKKAVDKDVISHDGSAYNPESWVRTHNQYDQYGRLESVIRDADGLALETKYEYDNQDQIIKTTLPNGKWTKILRNGRGLVKEQRVGYGKSVAEGGTGEVVMGITQYEYDANGNLEKQIFPDLTETTFEYDDFDRLRKKTQGITSGD